MGAFRVLLRPSRWLLSVSLVLFVLTLLVLVFYSSGGLRVLWLFVWLCSLGWAWFGCQRLLITEIYTDAQGQAWLRCTGRHGLQRAQLLPDSVARAQLLALRWQTAQGTVSQLLLPDMTGAEAWRRLQVWVRWCQSGASGRSR